MANPSTAAMIKARIIREQLAKEKKEKDSRNPNPKTPTMMGQENKKDKDRITQRDLEEMKQRLKNIRKKNPDRGFLNKGNTFQKLSKGGLKGNQKKLDKNNNNRIDAQDFKILKAEKAKGRGMGLQDEKVKPGKVMKAKYGTEIKPKGPGVLRPKPTGLGGKPLKPKPIKPNKKMGGGMMMKPMGYKSGTMVMARGCKLGRKKATKIT